MFVVLILILILPVPPQGAQSPQTGPEPRALTSSAAVLTVSGLTQELSARRLGNRGGYGIVSLAVNLVKEVLTESISR